MVCDNAECNEFIETLQQKIRDLEQIILLEHELNQK